MNRRSTKGLKLGGNTITFVLWNALPGLEKAASQEVSWESAAEIMMAGTRKGMLGREGRREGSKGEGEGGRWEGGRWWKGGEREGGRREGGREERGRKGGEREEGTEKDRNTGDEANFLPACPLCCVFHGLPID